MSDDMPGALELKCFNPTGLQVLRYMQDEEKRLIICYGGSSSGKSYSIAQVLLMMTFLAKENCLVMRKVGSSISKSIYEDFRQCAAQLKIADKLVFRKSVMRIVNSKTGARIDFAGLDDPEKIKGISNYRWVFMDEWSEFDEGDFKQIRKRLRGRRGQQIITAFNPIKETHWIKQNVIDRETWSDEPMQFAMNGFRLPSALTQVKSLKVNSAKTIINPRTGEEEEHAPDAVLIQSTYLNNFWVVGSPDGTYGYYDEQCIADFEKDRLHDPDYYNVYALGEWGVIRTGSEYFASFTPGRDTAQAKFNPDLPMHISVDNNVLPYITYTFWQVDYADGITIRQVDEVCASNPDNTAVRSAALVAQRLKEIGYEGKIYLHGDCTTRSANTIDEQKRSFLDLVISSLVASGYEVEDCVSRTNPNTAMSGEFINRLLEGAIDGCRLVIGDNCKISIEDYVSVQKDANGGIQKTRVRNKTTGQTYEEHGHCSDTMRYVVCDILQVQFIAFANKRKRNLYAQDGYLHFYNPDTKCAYSDTIVYVMPNVKGRFVLVKGCRCGEKWHIADIGYCDTSSTEEIKKRILAADSPLTYVECAESYYAFVRELRSETEMQIRALPESGDIDRRITATSDFVRSNVLFSAKMMETSAEYGSFVDALLDYNKDSSNKEASAALSGFVKMCIRG